MRVSPVNLNSSNPQQSNKGKNVGFGIKIDGLDELGKVVKDIPGEGERLGGRFQELITVNDAFVGDARRWRDALVVHVRKIGESGIGAERIFPGPLVKALDQAFDFFTDSRLPQIVQRDM